MTSIRVPDLNKCFYPHKPIDDPRFFVGREAAVKSCLDALQSPGCHIAILGYRGLGKSSLASQLTLLAEGDDRLVNSLHLERHMPRHKLDYITYRYSCSRGIYRTSDLLYSLLRGNEPPSLYSLAGLGDDAFGTSVDPASGSDRSQSRRPTSRTLKPKPEEDSDYVQAQRHFLDVMARIVKFHPRKHGIVIVLDEYDLIGKRLFFGDTLKIISDSWPRITVAIVGIAHNINDLMTDHMSIARSLIPVQMAYLEEHEIRQVLTNAEKVLGDEISFSEAAKKQIVKLSIGLPHYVHLFADHAAKTALDRHPLSTARIVVDDLDMTIVREAFSNGTLRTIYDEFYRSIVNEQFDDADEREFILKQIFDTKGKYFERHGVREAIVKRLKPSTIPGLVDVILDKLVRNDILQQVTQGKLRILQPGFGVYVMLRNSVIPPPTVAQW